MGDLSELAGAVDEAEMPLKEGRRLAGILHLPQVEAAFASDLGELPRGKSEPVTCRQIPGHVKVLDIVTPPADKIGLIVDRLSH